MFATEIGLLAAALVLSAAPGGGSDDLTLARETATQFEKALPGYKIKILDGLTLTIDPPGPGGKVKQWQINLDRIAQFCRSDPKDCGQERDDFVAKFSVVLKQPAFVPNRADLRAVVRPSDYVQTLERLMNHTKVGGQLVFRPLAADLNAVCYFDAPTSMKPVSTSDLTAIGVAEEAAVDICEKNVRATLPPLPTAPPKVKLGERPSLNLVHGNSYFSSYVLLHNDWAALANSAGGRLLVAVPDDQSVLFIADDGPESVKVLSAAAKIGFQTGERPISTTVLRWTPIGWDVATP